MQMKFVNAAFLYNLFAHENTKYENAGMALLDQT